jgi:phage gp45-like
MQWEHDDAVRAVLRRFRVLETDDSGTQQKTKLAGLKNERPEEIVRIQGHGITSHAPKESEGVGIPLGGRADRLMILGLEHKDKRPKNLPEGGVALYDADGKVLKIVKDNTTWNAGDKPWELTNATTVKINAANDLAIGVNGRWIRVRPGRVDLGITSPTGTAPHGVETAGGTSAIVFAVVS